jgi:hypothetical protein
VIEQPADGLDTLIAFVRGLRASRDGHRDTGQARRRLEALRAAHDAVEAAGERLAGLLIAELVGEQARLVDHLEDRDAERDAEERRRLLGTICGMENHAADVDGGWTDYGIAEFMADVEAWGKERMVEHETSGPRD